MTSENSFDLGQMSESLQDMNSQAGSQVRDKTYLSVMIKDTGSGMTLEAKKRCFTLFGNLKFKKDIN